jgi:hypothetical protein
MAHISVSPPSNATTFSPLAKAFNRITKDGSVPVMNFLLGSHYNSDIGNEMTFDSTGQITNDSIDTVSGKIEIAAESIDGTAVTKSSTFSPFMFFYQGTKIVGHMELQDATVTTGDYEILRYEFTDLATNDKLQIDLEAGITGTSDPQVVFREIVGGSANVLSTTVLTTATKEINFQLDFLDEGISKFYVKDKTASGAKTRVFSGNIAADIGECSLGLINLTDIQSTKTLKSDFIWLFYPKVHVTYDVELTDRLNGRCRVWDTENEVAEADWQEVFSADHKFVGERVVENGLIRLWFKSTPGMEVYNWDGVVWALTGEVRPKTTQGDLATTLHDVLFDRFSNPQMKMTVKYGIVDHVVDLRRGGPYCRIAATSKSFRIDTTKERVIVPVKTTASQIPDFNQLNSDDANRGNPLNLSPTVNPFTFTNDSDTTTGLLLLNDNYMCWYDTATPSDSLGFIGFMERPIGCEITATDSTTLSHITWDFTNLAVVCVGTLTGNTSTTISGIITPVAIGSADTYVKYRANEGVWSFTQRMSLRKKR